MAQHIPLEAFKQKKFIAIRQQIEKAFNSPRSASYLKGSLKYIWERATSEHLRANEDEDVFLTTRNIGKGFVWGADTGTFEIHYNRKTNKVYTFFVA